MSDETNTNPGQVNAPALLINQPSRSLLAAAELESLIDAPLELATARQVGHVLGISGAQLFLFGQLNSALRWMCRSYLKQHAYQPAWEAFRLGGIRYPYRQLGRAFRAFQRSYPIRGLPPAALQRDGRGREIEAARSTLTAELCLFDIQSDNPALRLLQPVFLEQDPALGKICRQVADHLSELPGAANVPHPFNLPLKALLQAPIQAAPDDLAAQVAYIVEHWAAFLPPDLLRGLQIARAIVLEEAVNRLPGPGPVASDFEAPADRERWQPAAFSADTDWMPNAVLLAKSIHVWLGQLGRSYDCRIDRLDQIPDEALDRLAGWGFNALWLIGIWERSAASRKIKQLRGNPEAEASAYALHSYRVAADLGGEAALSDLETRCAARGIRLACDVVPNHTGIDSEWMQQHPDWFIQCDTPPYPAYRFQGPDLSENPAISIRIEDGYWDHTDAAVVFEHLDHHSGRRRYIYHGNDGTHMPWNDTAQLNFLLPEVRQAMSDLILETARRFRLIRFDAAMTLARKHFRRLWYPPPGGSAGVSSRSAFWLEDEAFDRAFPREFWRDVVDRINREAPDTLLIAEAFWMMESYFVRDLGMHRVYNSAFMNLLKQEDNVRYRRILKDVLAYNPEILKRYVNFMNNPDEATAVEQFGKGDKYFGTAVMLATLPGLPMFGHGQVEGLREKYGMEYRRAYWDEEPDPGFISHHEAQIIPLLHRRRLFSEVAEFALYDFATDAGIDENVYAFSNGSGRERWLVVYNNSPAPTSGRISMSVTRAVPGSEGRTRPGRPLAEELDLSGGGAGCYRFRNHRDGRERLRSAGDMSAGLDIELDPYQYEIYHDFRWQDDPSGIWARLCDHLGGRPVASLDEALLGFCYQDIWQSAARLFAPARLHQLAQNLPGFPLREAALDLLAGLNDDLIRLAEQLATALGRTGQAGCGAPLYSRFGKLADRLEQALQQTDLAPDLELLWYGKTGPDLAYPLLCWQLCEELRARLHPEQTPAALLADFKRFGVNLAWRELLPDGLCEQDLLMVELLLHTADGCPHPAENRSAFEALFSAPAWQALLGINRHGAETWFDRDRMEALAGVLVLQRLSLPTGSVTLLARDLARYRHRIEDAAASGYRLQTFLSIRMHLQNRQVPALQRESGPA